jgi:hypothetical protein
MRRRTDIASGLVLAVFALLLIVWVIPANTSPPHSEGNLSPAFLPTVAASVMLVLSALLAVTSWFARADEPAAPHEEFGEEARGLGLAESGDIAVWSLFGWAMMAGFLTIGFLATAMAGLAAMMLYAGERNRVAIPLVAIALPLALQQIAWHAFSVQLP